MFDASSLRAFSPLYASPEMIDGDEEADPRDDVFSLACITYELISGNHPFGRKSAAVARGKGQTGKAFGPDRRSVGRIETRPLLFLALNEPRLSNAC